MANNKDGVWEKLDWAKKVGICQQGVAIGDTLLLTLVVMLVALEAMLFTILVSKGWGQCWSIILAVLGTGYPFFHSYLFEKREIRLITGEKSCTIYSMR